nr:immunoglobulin light chain junction region [Macaca mulatta]
CLQYITTPFTF